MISTNYNFKQALTLTRFISWYYIVYHVGLTFYLKNTVFKNKDTGMLLLVCKLRLTKINSFTVGNYVYIIK